MGREGAGLRWAFGGAAAAMVGAVYAKTMFASIPGGDSGELVAEACTLGHAHPPGYPLFTMLYHAVLMRTDPAWWPGSEKGDSLIAWKANAVSAFLGSVAVAFVQAAVADLCSPRFGTLLASLVGAGMAAAYGLSQLVWQYSTGAEVFALNNALIAVLVWLTVRYGTARSAHERDWWIRTGAFWCGLALCNQHTAILFEVPLVGWILWRELWAGRFTERRVATWAALFVLGLLPYAYLPVALTFNRQQGSWGDTTTAAGFVHHLRRGDYGTFRLYSHDKAGAVGPADRIWLYLQDLANRQGVYVIPILGAAGAWLAIRAATGSSAGSAAPSRGATKQRTKGKAAKGSAAKASSSAAVSEADPGGAGDGDAETRKQQVGAALLGAWVFYVVVFHVLSNMPLDQKLLFGVQARFWMQPNLIVFVLASWGLCAAAEKASFAFGLGRAGAVFGAGVFCCWVCGMQLWLNFEVNDQSANVHMERYGRALLSAVPSNSLVVVGYDQQWTTLRYLQQCNGFRPDVTVVNGPMLSYAWVGSYREVYNEDPTKCVHLPGTHWVMTGSPAHASGGFAVVDFLRANMPRCKGGVYWTGKLPYSQDKAWESAYAMVNVGMLAKFVPKGAGQVVGATTSESYVDGVTVVGFQPWLEAAMRAWAAVDRTLQAFPDEQKYSPETWEWTLARDYFDHLCTDASTILSHAVEVDDRNLMALAAAMLQRSFLQNREQMSAANVKNLGLAFVKLVQSKQPGGFVPNPAFPYTAHLEQIFGSLFREDGAEGWRNVAASRALEYWTAFLDKPDATEDVSYATIKQVVAQLSATVAKSQSAGAPPEN